MFFSLLNFWCMCLILLLRQVVVRRSSISYYRCFFLNADYCNITSSRLLVEEAEEEEEEEGGREGGDHTCARRAWQKFLAFETSKSAVSSSKSRLLLLNFTLSPPPALCKSFLLILWIRVFRIFYLVEDSLQGAGEEESGRQRNSLERCAERAIPLLNFNRHLRQFCTCFSLVCAFVTCARTRDRRRIAHGKLRFYGLSEFGLIRNRAVWSTTKLVLQMAVFQNNRCWFCSAIWGGAVPVPAT